MGVGFWFQRDLKVLPSGLEAIFVVQENSLSVFFTVPVVVSVLCPFSPEAGSKTGGGGGVSQAELSWCIFQTFQISD